MVYINGPDIEMSIDPPPEIFIRCPFSTWHSNTSVYKTCKSQGDGVFLKVPHFASSVYKSTKHFDLNFAYTPKILNDLPDDVRSSTSLHSFRKKLKTYLFAQAYPP